MNDTIFQEGEYESRHIAGLLEISDSTLRKWCLALEKQGYLFTRDSKDNRIFTDRDIFALRTLKEITNGRKMTIENGAVVVVQQFAQGNVEATSTIPTIYQVDDRSDERYGEVFSEVSQLRECLQQQVQIMKEQTEIMRNQHETIHQLVQRMDIQDRSIQSSQQVLLDQVKEEIAATRKSWWKLW